MDADGTLTLLLIFAQLRRHKLSTDDWTQLIAILKMPNISEIAGILPPNGKRFPHISVAHGYL